MKTTSNFLISGDLRRAWALLLLATTITFGLIPAFGGTSRPSTDAEVKRLVTVLSYDAGQKEKADACRELARIGNKEAVAALAALLADEKLSHMARYGLETIPSPAVDKAFRKALGELNGLQLVGVICSVGVRQDAKAVEPLAKLLRNPDPDVAQAAARALGSIGTESAAKALEKALPEVSATNQVAFCEGMFRTAERLLAAGKTRRAAEMYDQVRKLQTPHQVRTAAWRGAILCRDRVHGTQILLQAIRSEDFSLFAMAMRISAEMPGAEITRILAAEFPKLPADNQLLLTQTLGNRRDPAALPVLFSAAKNSAKAVRIGAIHAISEIGQTSAVPVLVSLLGDPDPDVLQAAQETLASLQGKDVDEAVMTLLINPDAKKRLIGMDLVVRRRMTSAIPKLLAATNDLDPRIRITAAKRLAELAGPAQIPALLRLLDRATTPEDLDAAEQALTAVCLRSPKADACAVELTGWLPKVRTPQQSALLRVLTAVGGGVALETVRTNVDSRDLEVRATAVRCLSNWSTDDAAPQMIALLRRGASPSDAMLLLRGYLRFAAQPDLSAEKRLAMCREASGLVQRDEERRLLLGALGGIASPEALVLIAPYLDDTSIKQEAVTASLNVAEKLLQGSDAGKVAPKVVEQLEKIPPSGINEELAKRVQALLEQARAKVGK